MPKGISPTVNPAREFYEIANDFAYPMEIIREALSNSYDAKATDVWLTFRLVYIPGTRAKMINIEIRDNGEGMSSEKKEGISSEIESFFNLGDSHKGDDQIGSKGHGSKIFYKSNKIIIDTWKKGKHTHAETEDEYLWNTLCEYRLPTYMYETTEDFEGKGTIIKIEGFSSKQNIFEKKEDIIKYIKWYTISGSFGKYFNNGLMNMNIHLKTYYAEEFESIDFGFSFPAENIDLIEGSKNYCKHIGPKVLKVPFAENKFVEIEIVGALIGEGQKDFIPDTYNLTGLWFCKDYMRIERQNEILENILGGEYYYRNALIFVNCKQFDLTANRNNVRQTSEEYDVAVEAIKSFLKDEVKNNDDWSKFLDKKREERLQEQIDQKRKKEQDRVSKLKEVIDSYNERGNLEYENLIIKIPRNEGETALLLQAMISTNHPGIDFKIGGYNDRSGTDLIIESERKGSTIVEWAELVYTLANLFKWSHPSESFHKIICWEIGNFDGTVKEENGILPTLIEKVEGRYNLNFGKDTIEVYVLKEILEVEARKKRDLEIIESVKSGKIK